MQKKKADSAENQTQNRWLELPELYKWATSFSCTTQVVLAAQQPFSCASFQGQLETTFQGQGMKIGSELTQNLLALSCDGTWKWLPGGDWSSQYHLYSQYKGNVEEGWWPLAVDSGHSSVAEFW